MEISVASSNFWRRNSFGRELEKKYLIMLHWGISNSHAQVFTIVWKEMKLHYLWKLCSMSHWCTCPTCPIGNIWEFTFSVYFFRNAYNNSGTFVSSSGKDHSLNLVPSLFSPNLSQDASSFALLFGVFKLLNQYYFPLHWQPRQLVKVSTNALFEPHKMHA